MKNSLTHVPYLDGWRGLAICAVYFGHFVSKASYWWIGSFGVQLFFVLSGFLMCNILFFKNTALPDFFARRLIRVAPTFIIFVLAMAFYSSTAQPTRFMPSTTELISTLLFLRSYLPADSSILNDNWPIAHLWSLNVEEHTYMFLALVAVIARQVKKPWATAAFLMAAASCSMYYSINYISIQPSGATPGPMRSEAAALGILAAVLLSYIKSSAPAGVLSRVHPILPVVSLIIAFICFTESLRWRGLNTTVAPLCLAFTINYLDHFPAACLRVLSTKSLRWIGRVSFSLYIWQQPFHFAVCHYEMNAWLGISLSLVIGVISFYGFENPVRLHLLRAWERRGKTVRIFEEKNTKAL